MSRFYDFAQIHHVDNMSIYTPKTVYDLYNFLKSNKRPIIVKGAGYSHGGHTLVKDGTQINLKHLSRVAYDSTTHTVSAMAGAIWYNVIDILSKFGRTVAEMQSY